MWPESPEQPQPLRTGLTTGTCATACAVASARYLLSQQRLSAVSVTLPRGQTVELQVSSERLDAGWVRTRTVKDAGDDPDVTHGATIFVDARLLPGSGVMFTAGAGVGTVTRAGLALAVGEPAINPVPRQMMVDHLTQLAGELRYRGGYEVMVGVEHGEVIAQKTMNPRLGIIGGLSILGTTGIVRPFSCAAWIASIHQGIDVARANGLQHIAATTGNRSEQAIQAKYQLDNMALIEMGDFVGAVLKHLRRQPVATLSICGGLGKISKLANGHMDLHSRVSAIDFTQLADVAVAAGADDDLQQRILQANTSIEALQLCQQEGVGLADALCARAWQVARAIVPAEVAVEVFAINRRGDFVGAAQ